MYCLKKLQEAKKGLIIQIDPYLVEKLTPILDEL